MKTKGNGFMISVWKRSVENRLYRLLYKRAVDVFGERGMVSFTFDDFPASALENGGAILEERGWTGTYYVATGLMDQSIEVGEACSAHHLETCAARGHEIGHHTFAHLNCCTNSLRTILKDLRKSQVILAGYDVRNFAYPYGESDSGAKALLGKRFDSCRGIGAGINSADTDLNDLKANAIYSGRGIVRLVELIEENRSVRGWLILYTHDVSESPSPFGCTIEDFETVTRAVDNSGQFVGTIGECLARLS